MNCPTCSHLLNRVGHVALWCARCGTMLTFDNDLTHTPKLVERCRQYADQCLGRGTNTDRWERLGIAEIISQPE